MSFKVRFTEEALAMLEAIKDLRVRKKIFDRVRKLEDEPEQQGKPLVDDLMGYRSVRAVGQRYRVVYRVKADVVEVIVIGAGIRKAGDKNDIYERLKKLLGRG